MSCFNMDLEIKKNLVSNWFKTLQDSICHDINSFEKNRTKFDTKLWKRSIKKMKVVENIEFQKWKSLMKSDKFFKVYGKFPNEFQKNILGAKKDLDFGHQVFLL